MSTSDVSLARILFYPIYLHPILRPCCVAQLFLVLHTAHTPRHWPLAHTKNTHHSVRTTLGTRVRAHYAPPKIQRMSSGTRVCNKRASVVNMFCCIIVVHVNSCSLDYYARMCCHSLSITASVSSTHTR